MLEKLIDGKSAQIILCSSIAFFLGCCGIAILKSSDFNLEAANTKISLSSQLTRAKNITLQLQEQAKDIDSAAISYQSLKEKYDRLLKDSNSQELKQLSPEIKQIETNTDRNDIKQDIYSTNKKIEQLEKSINQ
jgi:uncharacterized protein Yka (UPF0111/DUF47 family)